MKVTFHWWQGSFYKCNHITVQQESLLFYTEDLGELMVGGAWEPAQGPS